MESKRIFIGTYIDPSIFEFIYDDIKEDFKNASFGKWVEFENLHFTYKFLGDTSISLLKQIQDDLSEILVTYNKLIQIKGIGAFPDLRKPKVLVANIYSQNNILQDISSKIDKILLNHNIKPEDREFKPHLTLQRIKSTDRLNFKEVIAKYIDYDFGEMTSFSVKIIESVLTSKGPIYKTLNFNQRDV